MVLQRVGLRSRGLGHWAGRSHKQPKPTHWRLHVHLRPLPCVQGLIRKNNEENHDSGDFKLNMISKKRLVSIFNQKSPGFSKFPNFRFDYFRFPRFFECSRISEIFEEFYYKCQQNECFRNFGN